MVLLRFQIYMKLAIFPFLALLQLQILFPKYFWYKYTNLAILSLFSVVLIIPCLSVFLSVSLKVNLNDQFAIFMGYICFTVLTNASSVTMYYVSSSLFCIFASYFCYEHLFFLKNITLSFLPYLNSPRTIILLFPLLPTSLAIHPSHFFHFSLYEVGICLIGQLVICLQIFILGPGCNNVKIWQNLLAYHFSCSGMA